MRFLLHPVVRTTKALRMEARSTRKALTATRQTHPINSVSPKMSSSEIDSSSYSKAWGQQCSPECGCVVRFEVTVDTSSELIVNATYHAKSIISVEKDGQLQPLLTTRTNKPMMKDCKCKTIHTLAKEVTTFVSWKKMDNVRNLSEFSYTRASPAFRHAVLVGQGLPRTDTHCFDVVEEAYTAMIKGFMPGGRRTKRSFDKILAQDYAWDSPVVDEDEHVVPLSRRENTSKQTPFSISSHRSVSTLRMFDIGEEYYENEDHHDHGLAEQKSNRSVDWLSFVDEQQQDQGLA